MTTLNSPGMYTAAEKAIHDLANKMIAELSWFEQGPARNALNDAIVKRFAAAAVDAAEAQRIKEIRP
jgi:hypothetical protein